MILTWDCSTGIWWMLHIIVLILKCSVIGTVIFISSLDESPNVQKHRSHRSHHHRHRRRRRRRRHHHHHHHSRFFLFSFNNIFKSITVKASPMSSLSSSTQWILSSTHHPSSKVVYDPQTSTNPTSAMMRVSPLRDPVLITGLLAVPTKTIQKTISPIWF